MITASVSGSSLKAFMMSICFSPLIGSPADSDRRRLPQPDFGQLLRPLHRSACPSARTTPMRPLRWMWPGMMPILISSGEIRPGQFGPNSSVCLPPAATLGLHLVADDQHVADRDAFGDADHQIEVGFGRLPDRRGSAGRRHVDHRDGCAGLGCRFLDRAVDRDIEDLLAGLLRIDSGDEAFAAIAVFEALLSVELSPSCR